MFKLRSTLITLALAGATAGLIVPPAATAATRPTVVPQFRVTSKLNARTLRHKRVYVMTRLRISGIHGNLKVGCERCRRYEGKVTKRRGHSSVTYGPNWIVNDQHSVLVSVVRRGRVGRFVLLGVAASRRSRLIYKDTGCMNSRRRLMHCPAGTRTIVNGQSVGATPASPQTTTTPAANTTPTGTTPSGGGSSPTTTTPGNTGVPATPRDTTAPPAPSGLGVTGSSQSAIAVGWQASADPSGISKYTIFVNGALRTTTTGLAATIDGLGCSTTVTIEVSATDGAGNTSARSGVQGSTQGCPPPLYPETVGNQTGGANTWSNYTNAGGTQGPHIGAGQTVGVSCKLPGFRVADGNTWWYRIGQSPWNDQFYVSADAFYNNGQTSGSLRGTPFVDGAVRDC